MNKNLIDILDTFFLIIISQLQINRFRNNKKHEIPNACNKKSDK